MSAPLDTDAIERALSEATTGPLEVRRGVCIVASHDGFLVAAATRESDAHLIANAPTWLRALLDDREQLRADLRRACVAGQLAHSDECDAKAGAVDPPRECICGAYAEAQWCARRYAEIEARR